MITSEDVTTMDVVVAAMLEIIFETVLVPRVKGLWSTTERALYSSKVTHRMIPKPQEHLPCRVRLGYAESYCKCCRGYNLLNVADPCTTYTVQRPAT